ITKLPVIICFVNVEIGAPTMLILNKFNEKYVSDFPVYFTKRKSTSISKIYTKIPAQATPKSHFLCKNLARKSEIIKQSNEAYVILTFLCKFAQNI
ncbi:hypothetical protein, partial [Campylobacter sp. JMF_05 ED3]|uniref:hypothetical protein n=1 Tax=Campylobacter sp. JMF_05 ED3 TaxID=2983838 RepID=UPI0022E9FFF7